MIEVQQAEEESVAMEGRADGQAAALRSPIRDVTTPHHDRDYRDLACFLLPHVRPICNSQICVIELDDREHVPTVYCFDHCQEKEAAAQPLFLLDHRGHLKWMKPTPDSTPTILRDRHTEFDSVYYIR